MTAGILEKLTPEAVDPFGMRKYGLIGAIVGMQFFIILLLIGIGTFGGYHFVKAINEWSKTQSELASAVRGMSLGIYQEVQKMKEENRLGKDGP
jgi:hypothetical protein